MTLGQQVASSLRQTALWRFGGQLVTWTATLIVVRLLSPEDYGLVAMAMMPVMLLTLAVDLGLSASVVQVLEITDDELRQVLGTHRMTSLITCTGLAAAAPLLAWVYEEPRATAVIQALAVLLLLYAFAAVPEAVLRRSMQFGLISKIEFSAAMVGAVCVLSLAVLGWGVWALVGGVLGQAAIKSIALNAIAVPRLKPEYSLGKLGRHLAFGRNWAGSNLIWMLYYGSDAAIIGSVAGSGPAGLYSVGKQIATLPSEKLMPFVNQILFRAFATIQADAERVATQSRRIMRLLLVAAIPVGWGFASIAPELVQLLLGSKWVATTPVVFAIGLVMPLWMVGTLSSTLVQSLGHADVALRSSIIALLVIPAGFLLSASRWGIAGAVSVWLVLHPLVIAINLIREFRVTKIGFSSLFREIWPAVLSGLSMLLTVALAGQSLPVDTALWLRLASMVGVGALTYLPLVYLLDRSSLEELAQIVRK